MPNTSYGLKKQAISSTFIAHSVELNAVQAEPVW